MWINSAPLKPHDLDNKLVLIHFWAFSCTQCRSAIPYLQKWWRRYRDLDFLIIGIHTPQLDFEKEPGGLRQAVSELGVQWPVVADNDYLNWTNYAANSWPAYYLFGRDGGLLFHQLGAGSLDEIEVVVQGNLRQTFGDIVLPTVDSDGHLHDDSCFVPTPEIHCGYARGRLDNSEGYNFDMPFRYRTSNGLKKDSIALLGTFVAKPEYVESAGEGATVFLQFRATEVNLVLKPVEAEAKVKLTFNGKTLPKQIAGRDVSESGEVLITKSTVYNLILSDHPLDGILGITRESGDFQAYTFTFSGCRS